MKSSYVLCSAFKDDIAQFVEFKRSCGFSYNVGKGTLMDFDNFCIANDMDNGMLGRELVTAWSRQLPSECINTRNARVSVVRQFALFLTSKGRSAHIPKRMRSQPIPPPHVMSDVELKGFFDVVDAYVSPELHLYRFSLAYPVLFRMLYSCGMRLAEACHLRCESIDLDSCEITILHSKGDKNRKIFMSEDLRALCVSYDQKMECILPDRQWFFPGLDASKHVNKGTVSTKFKEFWSMTPYAGTVDRQPTAHCLRTTFVVNRVNEWIQEGKTLENCLPYLCRHLGHASVADSWYYYHLVEKALPIILDKDLLGARIIPEVRDEDEIE